MIQSHIDGLALAVHPTGSSGGVFVMVKSYWDESGIQDGSPVCLIAGYFGGVNQWKRFERDWNAVLKSEGIEEFHAKKFWAQENGRRIGDYAGWTNDRASRFIDTLARIIHENGAFVQTWTNARLRPLPLGVPFDTLLFSRGTRNWARSRAKTQRFRNWAM